MHAVLVLWDLSAGSRASIERLRDYIRTESIARFSAMEGLRQKTWISNPETQQWGAVYLFETHEQAGALASHISAGRVVELTGLVPAVQQFDVEAVVEGRHSGADLLAAGLARTMPAP